jgi:4'-phosphopantetheinyl transferase
MSVGDCSSDLTPVRVWGAKADPELAQHVAPELPGELLERLQQLPEPARRRRIVQQALRRSILAGYAGVKPRDLQLAFAPGGPIVSPIDGVLLSASHFDDVTTFAIGRRGLALGIDIEPEFEADWEEAVEMVLTETEVAELNQLSGKLRAARYFELWTLKESVMKALGAGLGDRDPGSIEIAISDSGPILIGIDAVGPTEPWGLWSGRGNGHVLSVALRGVRGVDPEISFWPVESSYTGC